MDFILIFYMAMPLHDFHQHLSIATVFHDKNKKIKQSSKYFCFVMTQCKINTLIEHTALDNPIYKINPL